jgi:large subunit ribosomal protein L3
MIKGLIGKKVGMTQVFDQESKQIPVTVVDVGSNVVVQKKSQDGPDGYSAVKLGYGDVKKLEKDGEEPEWRLANPEVGVFESAGIDRPRKHMKEIRVEESHLGDYEVGQQLSADFFEPGEWVDVTGKSKGRGFSGVMRRHNFSGAPAGHGTKNYFRHGGSIGQAAAPARVFPGRKMPGQQGDAQTTIQNLRVVQVVPDEDALLIKGGLPGPKGGLLIVKTAVKKHHG